MKTRYSVALLIETSNSYARGLLHGIRGYVRAHGGWSIYMNEQSRGQSAPTWLNHWHGDGVIARIETEQIAQVLVERALPTIDLSAARHVPSFPYVETDDREIARAAADHLMGRGFKQLAFCGDRRFTWSNHRREYFQEYVEQAGRPLFVHETKARRDDWQVEQQRLVDWLRALPKPVGVMACYDIRGREVLEACRAAGIAVPYEVAVIGVDDDELICDLSDPPLSSVIPNAHRTGYEAAAMLDRMMAGAESPTGAHLIPPLGIAVRQSSDILAIDDADVAAALRFIHDHAAEGVHVEDVLAQVPVSRRVLETRFRELVGRTPHQEILRVQIDRVKQLLATTDLTLEAIAHRCGFRHAEYMNVVFKRLCGTTPGKFRANCG